MIKIDRRFKPLILIAIALLAVWGYDSFLSKKKGFDNMEPAYKTQAPELYKLYSASPGTGNKLYLDKLIEVDGQVSEILPNGESFTIFLFADSASRVSCTLDKEDISKISDVKLGTKVKIRGRCAGLFNDLVLVDCYFAQIKN
jgi:hypothetical protein